MILEELHLKNFGAFRDPEPIRLRPSDPSRPVILVGALNGSGKTTILEALQLCLFGKRSRPARSFHGGYYSYLASLIHHSSLATEGTHVKLEFSTGQGSSHRRYEVLRSWTQKGDRVAEYLDVSCDGVRDADLSENWDYEVESFIPLSLSELFFFDGEKIERLADPESSSAILKTAISALLGADLVDQLLNDLEILKRKKASSSGTSANQESLEALQYEAEALGAQLKSTKEALDRAQTSRDGAVAELVRREEEFARSGGSEYERRAELNSELKSASSELEQVENDLRELASESLPIALLGGSLQKLLSEAEAEDENRRKQAIVEALGSRDQALIEWAKQNRVSSRAIDAISGYLEASRDEMSKSAIGAAVLEMSPSGMARLRSILESTLPRDIARSEKLVAQAQTLEQRIASTSKRMSRVPPDDLIKAKIQEVAKAQVRVSELDKEIEELSLQMKSLQYELDSKNGQLRKLVEATMNDATTSLKDKRLAAYSDKVATTLRSFRQKLVRHHLANLEGEIQQSFQLLWRKAESKVVVSIHPETYELTLRDESGRGLHTSRLSAGERQLLAVSILWGLAKASGRPLPVVIDTPLGRLDGEHRRLLLTRYFPDASHQVVLLSTDTEIIGEAAESLEDSIAHTYTLRYEEHRSATRIEAGYFLEAS